MVWKPFIPPCCSEETRIRLGLFLETYTVGSFGASFFWDAAFCGLAPEGPPEVGSILKPPPMMARAARIADAHARLRAQHASALSAKSAVTLNASGAEGEEEHGRDRYNAS